MPASPEEGRPAGGSRGPRIAELDALRGWAALAVMAFHYTTILPRLAPQAQPVPFALTHGHYGVQVFFVISGFVIFMTLRRCRTGADFVWSRVGRLYPAFWTAATLTFLVGVLAPLPEQAYTGLQYLLNLTMFHEYLKVASIDGVYWSLSYEVGFYVAMYLLFRAGLLRYIEVACAFWIVAALWFATYKALIPHPLHYLLVVNAYSHLFAAGIVLFLWQEGGGNWQRAGLLAGAVAVQYATDGPLGAAIVAATILLFRLIAMGRAPMLRFRPFVFFGTISYSLYLLHQLLGFRLIDALQRTGWTPVSSTLAATACMVLLATAVTYGIERPAAERLRRLRPALGRRRHAATEGPGA